MKSIKNKLKRLKDYFLTKSMEVSAKEQGFNSLNAKLRNIVPNIEDQYSSFKIGGEYLNTKVRNMHAFQISLIDKIIGEFEQPVIVDIGDSSGTHLQYLKGLYSHCKDIKTLSVNFDKEAINRIKDKNLEAIQTRAEDLQQYNIDADIFLCFEILEHLMNPCNFLHKLSSKTKAKYLVATVPYLQNSRVGLHHIRSGSESSVNSENTHIFEFSPQDWKTLFQFSGWRVVFDKIYRQYPAKHWLWITKYYWKKYDFPGFYGAVLIRDDKWSNLYTGW